MNRRNALAKLATVLAAPFVFAGAALAAKRKPYEVPMGKDVMTPTMNADGTMTVSRCTKPSLVQVRRYEKLALDFLTRFDRQGGIDDSARFHASDDAKAASDLICRHEQFLPESVATLLAHMGWGEHRRCMWAMMDWGWLRGYMRCLEDQQ